MPRISAPTVAEHRANQRAAVLAAAEAIVTEGGPDALTIAAVAARTGLARPSVYAYFPSVDALLAALVEAAFERWPHALEAAAPDEADPVAAIRTWFEAVAASAAAGDHRLAGTVGQITLPEEVRTRLAEGHRRTSEPLERAVAQLGAPPADALPLLWAVASECVTRVEAGADPTTTARAAARFAVGGLRALAGPV